MEQLIQAQDIPYSRPVVGNCRLTTFNFTYTEMLQYPEADKGMAQKSHAKPRCQNQVRRSNFANHAICRDG
jgi:hypothetical protein